MPRSNRSWSLNTAMRAPAPRYSAPGRRGRAGTRQMRAARAAACLAALLAGPIDADVTSVTPGSFTSTHVEALALPPEEAWTLLTEGLPRWWDAAHSYGTVAENLSLTAAAGGCLCETLPNAGWVEHLRVTFVQPPALLRMEGALGPLAEMGLQGVMTWRLEPAEDGGSLFTSRYLVSGQLEGGFEQLAPVVDGVNGGHFRRLARVARGLPPDPPGD